MVSSLLRLSRLIDALNRWVGSWIIWLILASTVISAVNAVIRKAFNMSSNAFLEVQWYLFAASFMLAAGYTLLHNEHVRIDVIVGRFSKRTQVWIDLFGFLLFLLPVCLLILYDAIPFARVSIASQEMSSNAGGLIVWPAKLLVPVGFFLLILQGISEIIKRIAYLAGKIDGHEFSRHVATPEEEIEAIKQANKIA